MVDLNNEFKQIGMRIKMLRIKKGISQVDLAKKMGVVQAHLSNIENGRSHVSLSRLFSLSEILECPVTFFLEEPKLKKKEVLDISVEDVKALLELVRLNKK